MNPNSLIINKQKDLQATYSPIRAEFIQKFANADYVGALNLLSSLGLDNQIFLAETLNLVSASILYLETFYDTQVTTVLANELIRFNSIIDKFRKIGVYSGSVQYYVNNFVSYNNEIYLCKVQPSIGTLPTNITYWEYLGLRGVQGTNAINCRLMYDWNLTTNYLIRDIVSFENTMYVAKTNNVNKNPKVNTSDWEVFFTITKRKIETSATIPVGIITGDIWYKPAPVEFSILDNALMTWNELDAMNLTWWEFEGGGFIG
ncbi:MAG: hypothetical protein WCO84_01435 [bacterium]